MGKQTLGMVISSLRKENEMTQVDLAAKMGVTDKAVSKWERDLSCPDISSLPVLAETLGVSVDELMQVKTESEKKGTNKKFELIEDMILKAIPLAMGVAVIVLSLLKEIDIRSGFCLLGIAVFCLAVHAWKKDNSRDEQ